MLNKCMFTGRIASDLRFFDDGAPRVIFTLAVDRNYKNSQQEYETDFFRFIAWRSTAEFIMKHCEKGDMIQIVAHARQRQRPDSNGQSMETVEFGVDEIYFCRKKRKQE